MIIINNLSEEIIALIKTYVQLHRFAFTNKTNYNLYHCLIKPFILNYENYIRNIIKRDNEFVFKILIKENQQKWNKIKNYIYKGEKYNTYLNFLLVYCFENDSNNCGNVLNKLD